MRVKDPERLIAAHGHVIGRGLLPGDGLFPAAAAAAAAGTGPHSVPRHPRPLRLVQLSLMYTKAKDRSFRAHVADCCC